MQRRSTVGFLCLALLGVASWSQLWGQGPVSIRGKVTAKGSPLEGAYVGAHPELSANARAVWFANQRLGRVIRFQEHPE